MQGMGQTRGLIIMKTAYETFLFMSASFVPTRPAPLGVSYEGVATSMGIEATARFDDVKYHICKLGLCLNRMGSADFPAAETVYDAATTALYAAGFAGVGGLRRRREPNRATGNTRASTGRRRVISTFMIEFLGTRLPANETQRMVQGEDEPERDRGRQCQCEGQAQRKRSANHAG